MSVAISKRRPRNANAARSLNPGRSHTADIEHDELLRFCELLRGR